jgi:hypothetical protein
MRAYLVGIVLIAAIGCGKSEAEKQAEEAAKNIEKGAQAMQEGANQMAQAAQDSSQLMAQGLQQMAQGFQQMAQGSAKAVDYEQLKALLPEISGWERSDARGEQVSAPIQSSRASANYRNGEARLELEIVDTALSQLLIAPIKMFLNVGFSERSDDGFKRATKVGGQPAFEEWNVESKHGEVTAVVGDRFIVASKGYDVENLDTVRKLVESVNLSKLSALK